MVRERSAGGGGNRTSALGTVGVNRRLILARISVPLNRGQLAVKETARSALNATRDPL